VEKLNNAAGGTAARMRRNLPIAERIALSGAGHNLPQEQPEAFADAVMELIKI